MTESMNRIMVSSIERPTINELRVIFDAQGDVQQCFSERAMFMEYSIPTQSVPDAVAIVPFVANVLPIAWICNARIEVPQIDKRFLDCISDIKQAYEQMYPMFEFLGGEIVAEDVFECEPNTGAEASILLYSGGVDSIFSLLNHIDKKPLLLTLAGSDIALNDTIGWERVCNCTSEASDTFGLTYCTVKSNFRDMLNEDVLNKLVEQANDSWWHGFQHGIGIASHAAPVSWLTHSTTVYFAATYSKQDNGVRCASLPSIDEKLHFSDCSIIHDGFDYTRQDKIEYIVKWQKQNVFRIPLRVCWASDGGSNCCNCEKCYRTILGLYAAGADPRQFGFEFSSIDELFEAMHKSAYEFLDRWRHYAPILEAMHENYCDETIKPSIKWFFNLNGGYDIEEISSWYSMAMRQKEVEYLRLHEWTEELQKGKDWLEEQYTRLATRSEPQL